MALFMVKTWMGNKVTPIYGAEWAGTSDPSWTRTDDAVGFSAPNPYYSGMSGSPSSPFDNIMPWSGMRKVYNEEAGWLVEIPKYYFKWTRNGVKMKVQISMTKHDGYFCSPAHADRGDGVGERDYVYIGRYHCASDYKSKTGVQPVTNITRGNFRTSIHALGTNIWQQDIAMVWTIRMLYLVEYATWDSQSAIGWGCSSTSGEKGNMGASDSMLYHTGTPTSTRSSYGYGVQYRYVEGLWDNVLDFADGIYLNNGAYYGILNPANFSDNTGGILVGNTITNDGEIKSWSNPSSQGFEYMLMPASVENNYSFTTYVCDYAVGASTGQVVAVGGTYNQEKGNGLFSTYSNANSGGSNNLRGSRLMILPPSRLSA